MNQDVAKVILWKKIFLVASLIAASVLTAASCGSKSAETRAAPAAAEAAELQPSPEREILLPAVAKGSEDALVVYRHTHPGYMETHGYDTLVYRLITLGGEALSGVVVSARGLGGETELFRASVSYAGDSVILSGLPTEPRMRQFFRNPASGAVESGPSESISLSPDGSTVRFDRAIPGTAQRFSQTYRRKNGGIEASLSVDGGIVRVGDSIPAAKEYPGADFLFRLRKPGDDAGIEDSNAAFWTENDIIRCRIEGVEPMGDLYAEGLSSLLKGDGGIMNLALIDALFDRDEGIRAVLVYAMGSVP